MMAAVFPLGLDMIRQGALQNVENVYSELFERILIQVEKYFQNEEGRLRKWNLELQQEQRVADRYKSADVVKIYHELESKYMGMLQHCKDLKKEKDEIQKKFEDTQKEKNDLEEKYEKLFNENSVTEKKSKDIQKEKYNLEERYEDTHMEKCDLEEKYEKLFNENLVTEKKSKNIQKEKDGLEEQYKHLQKEKDDLEEKYQEVINDNKVAEKKCEHLQKEKDDLEEKYQEVINDNKITEKKCEDLQREKENLEEKFEDLQREKENLEEKFEKRSYQPPIKQNVINYNYRRWKLCMYDTKKDIVFEDCDISNVSFSATRINHNIQLTGCNLTNCRFAYCFWWSCDKQIIFDGSNMNGCSFVQFQNVLGINIKDMITDYNNVSFKGCKNVDTITFVDDDEFENKKIIDFIKKKFDL